MLIPRAIASTVDGIARQAIGKDWNLYAALLGRWPEIAGEDYARRTTPVKISFPKGKPDEAKLASGNREGGILHIRLPQGLVMEFTFHAETVRQRITDYFGYNAVTRIRLEPYYGASEPTASPAIQIAPERLAELKGSTRIIENNDLREALEALGQTVLRQPHDR